LRIGCLPTGTLPKSAYSHAPRPTGVIVSYLLDGDRLKMDSLRRVQHIRLSEVEEIRLTYEPGRLGDRTYRTQLTPRGGRPIAITSFIGNCSSKH
jgi:hypothetical protein